TLPPSPHDALPIPAARTLLANGNGGESYPLFTAPGCEACAFTGYQGRSGIFELLLIDDESRRLIHDRAAEADLRDHARSQGMKSLRQDGMRCVPPDHPTL